VKLYHGGVDAGECLFLPDAKTPEKDVISLDYLERFELAWAR
jgi:hypothetical protein